MNVETLKEEGYTHCGENICSNFDHIVDQSIVERMKTEKIVADYPAWNFHGSVWFKDGKFHCAVMQYHELSEIISADTFDEVKEEVCEKFGSD